MKAIKHAVLAIALVTSAVASLPAFAQAAAKSAAEMTDAEVRKVDKEQKKITLKHGEIKDLDMPAMTMVFNVSDVAVLENLQAGDKVRFRASNEGGKFTATELQPVK
jgi:Cu/Ag efflux protein CusF